MTNATPGLPRGRGYVVRSGLSDWSLPVIAQLPKRPSAPAGVTIGIQAALESLILTWQSPTTLADGTPLKVGALFGFIVYWSKTAGIDIDNPATYLGKEQVDSERYVFTVPDPSAYLGPYHFVVTAVDTEGTQSLPSAEVTATASGQEIAPPFADDWATGNAEAILVGKGRIFVKLRPPKPTWSGSAYYKIYTDIDTGAGFSGTWTWLGSERVGFMHSPLNETHKFRYKVTVVDENGIETTGTIHDNVGLGYQPNQANQNLILADTVAAQNMIAQYDMIAQTFVGGVLQSVNWGGAAGTQFDLDGGTFQIGGSTAPKLSWDGTTLSVVGAITIQSGSGIANLTDAGILATRNTIASTHIDANAVTTPKVAANAITADKINVTTLSAITANMGTLTAGQISVAGGLVKIGTNVWGTADGIYIGKGGTIIITDSDNEVVFDATSKFQGGMIKKPWGINGVRVFGPAPGPGTGGMMLDLSPWIESRLAMVFLQIRNNATDFSLNVVARPRGSTRVQGGWADHYPGATICRIAKPVNGNPSWNALWGLTNTSGQLHIATDRTNNFEIWLVAYFY